MNTTSPFRYLLLYLPWLISISTPNASTAYLTAWAGSFFIFFVSMTGKVKPIPTDLPLLQQILRPLFLIQIIFAGYMACTSIFFYLDSLGYTYFDYTGRSLALMPTPTQSIASCQQYYVLAHAALVHGILVAMKYPVKLKALVRINDVDTFLIKVALISFPIAYLIQAIPGLNTFSIYASSLTFVAATLALATSISSKNKKVIIIASILYTLNLLKTLTSGFKEPVIISLLLLGVFLLPVFGKKLLIIFIPLMVAALSILPTYVNTFREARGTGGADYAKEKALEELKSKNSLAENNWIFLVNRLSEISMFIQFRESVPSYQPYYGFTIFIQSLYNIIPRVFWPGKPDTELLIMSRVYKAGVVDPLSEVSAKPPPVVDGYLSGGMFGVWITLFLYGLIAQLIAIKAEQLFGGFLLGLALVFTGFFSTFWRGNSLEFMVSTIFWAYLAMLIFHSILKRLDLLTPIPDR